MWNWSGCSPRPDRAGAWRLWPLAAATAVVVLLAVTGVLPRWPGLVHLVALPPVDLFTDLRVLITGATSVPWFLLLVPVFAARVVLLALLLGGLSRARVRFAAGYYAAVLLPALLAAQLDFMAYAVLYSRLFWGALALLAVVVLVAGPAPWQGEPRGQREPWGQREPRGQREPWGQGRLRGALTETWRRGLRIEVLLPYAAVLVGIGVLADRADALAVALVPVSAAATAVTIRLLARPPRGRPMRRLAAVAVAAVLVAAGFAATRETAPAAPAAPRGGSLLIMSGINSASGRGAIFETDVTRLGYECGQVYYFSYAGPGSGAAQGAATCPIRTGAPYRSADTMRPVADQVDAFVAQVAGLPRPLVVAAHSHAVWIAWAAVAQQRAPGVDVLVLVGPFPDSPVGYPAPGASGPGRVGGDLLRVLIPLTNLMDFHFDPDAPGTRELLATAHGGAEILALPLPSRVATLSMPAAPDLPLMTGGWRLPVDRNACPVREAHPDLPRAPAYYDEINRFLDGRPARDCPPWRDWAAPAGRPFGVPPAPDPPGG